MCIAIVLPAGATIPFEHLVEGQKHNPDGCGLAWVEDGEICTFKSMDFKAWTAVYESVIERLGNINMLIHFRITSRGKTSVEMCHPFMVGEDICIIHNGTINAIKATETANGDSDTKVLAEQILANMPLGWESNKACHRLIEEFCGWSKICILTKENEMYIINESSGYWVDDVWYSNKSYVSYKPTVYKAGNYNSSTTSVYTPPKGDVNDRFWGDMCDDCYLEFGYNQLKLVGGRMRCTKCEADFNRSESAKLKLLTGTKAVFQLCSACNCLVDSTLLWYVEIDFMKGIDEEGALEGFDPELVVQNSLYSDIGTTHICEDCYVGFIAADVFPENIMNITAISMPEEYIRNGAK